MSKLPRFGLRSGGILLVFVLGLQFILLQNAGAQQTISGNTTGGITVGSGNTLTIGTTGTTGVTPGTVIGNVTICGPVTSASPGALTQSGVVINTGGAAVGGTPVVVGGNYCSQIQVNQNNQVTNVLVTPNTTGSSFVCTASCFLLSPVGTVTGQLSFVPIAATPIQAPTVVHRVGRDQLDY